MDNKKLLAKITDKWPAKVLSVAAALILFTFHQMSTMETRFFSAPLLVETGMDFVPASSYLTDIRVSIRGEANKIYPILDEDIEVYIDLKHYTTEGAYQVPVQIRKKGSALRVDPLEITVDPLEIPLRLERRVSRNTPIRPVFRGAVAAGFELISYSLNPAGVAAEGPRSAMESVMNFQTDIIDLEGRNEDFIWLVNIINQDPFIVIRGNRITEFHGIVRRSARMDESGPRERPEPEELSAPESEDND